MNVDEKSRRIGSGVLDGEKLRAVSRDHGRGVRPVVAREKDGLSCGSSSSDGSDSGLKRGDERSKVGKIVWNE